MNHSKTRLCSLRLPYLVVSTTPYRSLQVATTSILGSKYLTLRFFAGCDHFHNVGSFSIVCYYPTNQTNLVSYTSYPPDFVYCKYENTNTGNSIQNVNTNICPLKRDKIRGFNRKCLKIKSEHNPWFAFSLLFSKGIVSYCRDATALKINLDNRWKIFMWVFGGIWLQLQKQQW